MKENGHYKDDHYLNLCGLDKFDKAVEKGKKKEIHQEHDNICQQIYRNWIEFERSQERAWEVNRDLKLENDRVRDTIYSYSSKTTIAEDNLKKEQRTRIRDNILSGIIIVVELCIIIALI